MSAGCVWWVTGALFLGALVGFVLAAIMGVGGLADDMEERCRKCPYNVMEMVWDNAKRHHREEGP